MAWRRPAIGMALIGLLAGCAVQGDTASQGGRDLARCDGGGCEDQAVNCGDGGFPCPASPEGGDRAACDALLARTCGSTASDGPGCPSSPGCTAATLLATYEPENCVTAVDDLLRYPSCERDACQLLLERVCGGSPPSEACAEAPGCPPALRLDARVHGLDAGVQLREEALASCAAALEDSVVFSPCP